jgi:hypothetical protein
MSNLKHAAMLPTDAVPCAGQMETLQQNAASPGDVQIGSVGNVSTGKATGCP